MTPSVISLLVLLLLGCNLHGEVQGASQLRGDDEPQLFSYRVLEGVTEPFAHPADNTPLWRQMKMSADGKAAKKQVQLALAEYGQLLKHSVVFGDMPLQERYDVFLSMSKLLRLMGFHQKAELVLYEALGYSPAAFEAHLELASLFLEKERMDKAKMHLKQCLYFREADTESLMHLAVILIAEGRVHEAKFYITRIQASLRTRIDKLSAQGKLDDFLLETLAQRSNSSSLAGINYQALTRWLEALLVRVFHGELHALMPGEAVDFWLKFSDLLTWLAAGEMNGRFVFDLGASLVEGGMPETGNLMLRRGHDTSDISEGPVSIQIIKMRIALDFPVVPKSLSEVIDCFHRMSAFFAVPRDVTQELIGLENTMDLYWVVPLLYYSALPTAALLTNLLERFAPGFLTPGLVDPNKNWQDAGSGSRLDGKRGRRARGRLVVHVTDGALIEVGLFSGHLNDHPVGLTVLHRLLDLRRDRFRITVFVFPQTGDSVTEAIRQRAARMVALPLDTEAAWDVICGHRLDIVLFPDWLPFPDQQNLIFSASRIAPVQICVFVRGSSCGSFDVDYYLLPSDLHDYHAALRTIDEPQTYCEQVVRVDWFSFTRAVVRAVSEAAEEPHQARDSSLGYPAYELEGQIFFEGQAVAVLPVDPSALHPLMDQYLFRILHACPHLTLLLVLHSSFLSATANPAFRLSWGRRLVRRLWAGDSSLSNRIRLLPAPVDSQRLLELLRSADLALDTFPLGSSVQTLALALSVGTPVVTLASGFLLRDGVTSGGADGPAWLPSLSALAGFYRRHNLSELIADSPLHYATLAAQLAKDREFSYGLRVRLLEALDAAYIGGDDEDELGLEDLERLLERLGAQTAQDRYSSSSA